VFGSSGDRVAEAVTQYAVRFHQDTTEGEIASPLGMWLLMALLAPAVTGGGRRDLEGVLGLDANTASAAAGRLLADPHPEVLAATAAWTDPVVQAGLAGWVDGLPESVERGDIPTQDRADAWADRRTSGLIKSFPTIWPLTELILASAIACGVDWWEPYEVVSAAELGPASPWTDNLHTVLRALPSTKTA
jgi:hypothetical protein